jgi:hypothetical protein
MPRIAILLDDAQSSELARMAQQSHLTEEELLRHVVDQLLRANHAPAVPRYARRLGPLTAA